MRVYNEVVTLSLKGDVRAKQLMATGPLLVKLPGDRGEVKAQSTDYIVYVGMDAVGILPADLMDALRLDKEEFKEDVPTGAPLHAVVKNENGTILAFQRVALKKDGETIAVATADEKGEVHFNVAPGTYVVDPVDMHGKLTAPGQKLEARVDSGPAFDGGLPATKDDAAKEKERKAQAATGLGSISGAPFDPNAPRDAMPVQHFNKAGQPDPNGGFDRFGLPLDQR